MHQHFFHRYQPAREHFLRLAESSGGRLESLKHPETGPDGDIFMDIAQFGDPDAARALVISSGTHGIEGYTGSGLQCRLLADHIQTMLPDDMQLLMVHGINPYGFAWQRRTNESNIDLNRNFINHAAPPVNLAYREMAEMLEPTAWPEQEQQFNENRQALVDEHGLAWFRGGMTGGQYEFPHGMFYGGQAPAWSNTTIRDVAMRYLKDTSEVIWLDIHTALGPCGTAECIVECPTDSARYARSHELWGERVKSVVSGDSHAAQVLGSMISGLTADMMDAFYPDEGEWREAVAAITDEVIQQCLGR